MHLHESEEQIQIRHSVRRLALGEIPKYQREEFFGTVPRELFSAFSGLGLTALSISEDFGGSAADPQTVAIVLEEIAAVDLGVAIFLSVHLMVSGLISKFGTLDQKKRYLTKLGQGKFLAAFALTEPSAGSDAARIQCSAVAKGDTFVINGEKCYITSAGWADLYIVFAKTDSNKGKDGVSAFLVEAATSGITAGKAEKKMGGELSPIASLAFNEVIVPKNAMIGEYNQGYRVALGGLATGRVNIGACSCGVSRTALNLALSHLKERSQFGSKLIEFQGLQFMLADMRMKLEAARLLTREAAQIISKDPLSRAARLHPSLAKCFASDAAMSITTDAVQLLGGAGYIREYQVERLMRDAKMLQIVEGTNQIQRMVIAREMAKGEE